VAFTPENVFSVQPPMPRGGAIWCAGPASVDRLGECCAVLALAKHEGARIYAHVRVLVPPGGPSESEIQVAAAAWTIKKQTSDDLGLAAAIAEFFLEHVSASELSSLDTNDLVAALPGPNDAGWATIIGDVGRYRGAPLPGGAELVWSTNVAFIARAACEAARANNGYALIETGRDLPTDPTARELLFEADDDCEVASAAQELDPFANLSARIDALVNARHFGEAVALTDTVKAPEAARLGFKAMIYLKAGMVGAAAQALRESRQLGLPASAVVALKFARAASQAKDLGLASEFLAQAIVSGGEQEVLEGAIVLADQIDDAANAAAASARLQLLFPRSGALLDHRLAVERRRGDLRAVADLLDASGNAPLARFYRDLAAALEVERPNYEAIFTAEANKDPSHTAQALTACVVDASLRGFRLDAVDLLLAHLGAGPEGAIRWLISAMAELLLADYATETHLVLGALSRVTRRVLEHLGANPSDTGSRAKLSNLLSTAESGLLGRIVLRERLAVLSACQPDTSRAEAVRTPPTQTEFEAFHARAQSWLEDDSALLVGQSRCPERFIDPSFHGGLLWALVTEIETLGQDLGPPEQDEGFLRYVGTVAAFAHAVDGPDRDLDIVALKLAGSQLARAGRLQRARDLVETVLQIADETPSRRRAAWFAYAEIHRLTGDPEEAALGMAAALSVNTPISLTEAWHETLDLIRVFRDLGERGRARALISRGGEILSALNLTTDYGSRLETLRLQIEQQDMLRGESVDRDRLGQLIADATDNARQVLTLEEEAGPIAAILVQSLRLGRRLGVAEPADAEAVSNALLAKLAPAVASRLERFSEDPTLASLTALAGELEGARYGHNFAQDLAPLVVLARRYLAQDPLEPVGTAYAVQLLADHGLLRRDESGLETPASLPTDPEAILAIAREISATGLGVTLLGRDENGRLIRADVVDGIVAAPVRESEAVFSEARLASWRTEFPKRYARLDEKEDADGPGAEDKPPPDVFEVIRRFDQSLAGIGVSNLPPQRVVVIPDASLADIPVNLLLVDNVFAGETRAMAAAPSLPWLANAAARRGRAVEKSHCWIPTEGAPADSLLLRVAEELGPVLATAGIGLTRQARMPTALENAELAIVAAHGELGALEERFFRGLIDEVGQVMAGDRLAHGLGGAKVAILFVCNGARIDVEPGVQAGLGLARQLLDRGCSAVIGSPWPLAGDVPARWLPAFLEAWNQGLPVTDANAFANERVGGLPNGRHALHVYGDPLMRR
jgi:Tfp pilus assembly protein PilF